MKNKKIGKIEKFFIKILPFSVKTTRRLLIMFSITGYIISGMLFSETIQEESAKKELAQNFAERVENTKSIK